MKNAAILAALLVGVASVAAQYMSCGSWANNNYGVFCPNGVDTYDSCSTGGYDDDWCSEDECCSDGQDGTCAEWVDDTYHDCGLYGTKSSTWCTRRQGADMCSHEKCCNLVPGKTLCGVWQLKTETRCPKSVNYNKACSMVEGTTNMCTTSYCCLPAGAKPTTSKPAPTKATTAKPATSKPAATAAPTTMTCEVWARDKQGLSCPNGIETNERCTTLPYGDDRCSEDECCRDGRDGTCGEWVEDTRHVCGVYGTKSSTRCTRRQGADMCTHDKCCNLSGGPTICGMWIQAKGLNCSNGVDYNKACSSLEEGDGICSTDMCCLPAA